MVSQAVGLATEASWMAPRDKKHNRIQPINKLYQPVNTCGTAKTSNYDLKINDNTKTNEPALQSDSTCNGKGHDLNN